LKTKSSLVPAIASNIDCERRSVHTFIGDEKNFAEARAQRHRPRGTGPEAQAQRQRDETT